MLQRVGESWLQGGSRSALAAERPTPGTRSTGATRGGSARAEYGIVRARTVSQKDRDGAASGLGGVPARQ